MEYVFGTKKTRDGEVETLKTIGEKHSSLSGRVTISRQYDDKSIDDVFTVIRKYASNEDAEKCYDYYEIKDHYRDSDRFTAKKQDTMDTALEKQRGDIDYIAMMSDIELDTEV